MEKMLREDISGDMNDFSEHFEDMKVLISVYNHDHFVKISKTWTDSQRKDAIEVLAGQESTQESNKRQRQESV